AAARHRPGLGTALTADVLCRADHLSRRLPTAVVEARRISEPTRTDHRRCALGADPESGGPTRTACLRDSVWRASTACGSGSPGRRGLPLLPPSVAMVRRESVTVTQPAIQVDHVYKTFRIPHEHRTTLKEHFLRPFKQIDYEQNHA